MNKSNNKKSLIIDDIQINWQTYDSTNVLNLRRINSKHKKILSIGMIIFVLLIITNSILLFYILYMNNFDFVLFSDGTEQLCFFDGLRIKNVK